MNEISKTTAAMTEGQRAYEARRAAKAGLSLDKWLIEKEKLAREAAKVTVAQNPKKKGLISRMLDVAHRPLNDWKKK